MGRRQRHRGSSHKANRKPNRYNPNKPDWNAVHRPWVLAPLLPKRNQA
jgi:hypothetical protein